ncbi:N-acetylmuramoyl-L-alanine amidase [Clostridium perfringens]|uniref:N-acetylmuramoyl-L-alanine amidase n=1 Tax=Clostridium perfringens TaxID=1502 RepID=UPI003D336359
MKIAVRGGHNFQAKGASALIDETTEDRKVYKSVVENLKLAGHNVLDVTPGNCDVDTDLYLGVKKAEEWGAELFVSIHFDKAYDTYAGALGTATWIYGTGGQAEVFAKRIVDSVANGTGLKNRGVRVNSKLYELRKTTMPAIIVEVCFCEATEDVRIYEEKGANLVGKLIAEGICNNSIENTVEETKPNVGPQNSQTTTNIKANARVVNDFLYARDSEGNKVGGYASEGDEIEVLDVSDSRQLALIKYPTSNGAKERYVTNATNCIEYFYQDQYKNGSTPEPVYQDSSCSQKIGTLNPYEKATPIYRKNGVLHVVYSTWKGRNTKSGFVKYNGGFDKF